MKMERRTFEIEVKRMRSALLRLAMHYMEDADEAEDVIQEVLLKLWFLREKLDQYRSMDALARVITKHLCLNRKRGQNIELVALEEGFGIIGEGTPEQDLVNEEKMNEILALIETLPDLQQAILRMKHIEGMEVEEMVS
jgi:RNA polymerase sigma-70 factor (ECF subfamily)